MLRRRGEKQKQGDAGGFYVGGIKWAMVEVQTDNFSYGLMSAGGTLGRCGGEGRGGCCRTRQGPRRADASL